MTPYEYKTEPFAHQRSLFERTRGDVGVRQAIPVFWEQGAAKTKFSIDDAADLYLRGEIDGVLVVAPQGVHLNWDTDELPKHCPDAVLAQSMRHVWRTAKAGTKTAERERDALVKHQGLSWLFISYDAFMSQRGKDFVWRFLKRRRVAFYLDESSAIKTPGAKRSKSIVAAGAWARYRRILDGTPVPNGPFDIWTPMRFLDSTVWDRNGFGSLAAFKTHFGLWRTAAQVKEEKGYDPGYDQLLGYRRLDQLYAILKAEGADRVMKEDVFDLPPKLYSKRYFELGPVQRRMYEELKEEFITFFESGEMLEASLPITRLLRLQQITCGYLPTEDGEEGVGGLKMLEERNPRIELFKETVETLPHPFIVWAKYTSDVDQIMEALTALGISAVRYDGQVSEEQRAENKRLFNLEDGPQAFVSKTQVGGTGLTLVRAKTEVFYNNDFNLRNRLQGEDRAHRAGMDEHPVSIIDLAASQTTDIKIIAALRGKFDIASQITGDRLRDWL